MMRTTLTIDDDIINKLMQTTREKTQTAAIRRALQEYLQYKQRQKLVELRGQVPIEDNWKALRELEKIE